MKFCIPSLRHLNMKISQKSIQLIKKKLLVKSWSKYTFELPNILFNQMVTYFSCVRQNVASVMDMFRENCPNPTTGIHKSCYWKRKHLKALLDLQPPARRNWIQILIIKDENIMIRGAPPSPICHKSKFWKSESDLRKLTLWVLEENSCGILSLKQPFGQSTS